MALVIFHILDGWCPSKSILIYLTCRFLSTFYRKYILQWKPDFLKTSTASDFLRRMSSHKDSNHCILCFRNSRYWVLIRHHSKQTLQQALKSWSNFRLLLLLAKSDKSLEQLWQVHVTTLTNPCINFYKSIQQLR